MDGVIFVAAESTALTQLSVRGKICLATAQCRPAECMAAGASLALWRIDTGRPSTSADGKNVSSSDLTSHRPYR